jgi:hypothetical protein
MYGPDAYCKLLFPDVETVCMHVSGLPLGDLPKHARSLDEIRAFCPWHISGMPDGAAGQVHRFQDAGSTISVITLRSFANHMNCPIVQLLEGDVVQTAVCGAT